MKNQPVIGIAGVVVGLIEVLLHRYLPKGGLAVDLVTSLAPLAGAAIAASLVTPTRKLLAEARKLDPGLSDTQLGQVALQVTAALGRLPSARDPQLAGILSSIRDAVATLPQAVVAHGDMLAEAVQNAATPLAAPVIEAPPPDPSSLVADFPAGHPTAPGRGVQPVGAVRVGPTQAGA